MHSKFFTTKTGSYLKHFLTVLIGEVAAQLIKQQSVIALFSVSILDNILAAALAAVIPVWYNSKNRAYTLYGKKPKAKDFPVESNQIKE